MLAALYNIPQSPRELSEWTFHNSNSHLLIVTALTEKRQARGLSRFVLDPLPQTDYGSFLLRHQIMHREMDGILGIGESDYTGINFDDLPSMQFLWFQHADEHRVAYLRLGING